MMYNYYWPMMGGGAGWGIFALLTWLVWMTVGVLLIVWLWKKISGK